MLVNPEGVADTDDDRRMLQHRCEDREGEHLLITDQDRGALVIDRENAGSVETKRDADSAERPPHSDRNRHALVKCSRFRADNQHRVVDGLWAGFDQRFGTHSRGPAALRIHPLKSVNCGTEVV